jgi:hypothetical protein
VTVATVAGLIMLLLSVPNVVPVFRAARADGAPGTFVADRARCVVHFGHESCSWYGTFRPAAGGPERRDITMYGAGKDSLSPGQRVTAVDVGRAGRVYPPSGSAEWIVTGVLMLAGFTLLLPLGRRAVTKSRSRRRAAATDSYTSR